MTRPRGPARWYKPPAPPPRALLWGSSGAGHTRPRQQQHLPPLLPPPPPSRGERRGRCPSSLSVSAPALLPPLWSALCWQGRGEPDPPRRPQQPRLRAAPQERLEAAQERCAWTRSGSSFLSLGSSPLSSTRVRLSDAASSVVAPHSRRRRCPLAHGLPLHSPGLGGPSPGSRGAAASSSSSL